MTRNDTRIIHTDGLEEGIRCAMCTNPMANNRGCDGGCDINESMYKRVLDVIKKNILEQEPCEDCISRQAVLDMMQMRMSGKELYKAVYELPPVNPQPKTGHWIRVASGSFIDKYVCSECKKTPSKRLVNDITWGWDFTKYCPNCGVKMIEPQESEVKE